ncbi:hypothetical protein F4780DRAFT_151100 [Xylariomycetidae sp. FL0641]|nr:hypothetical protein F4780DRAFT_151100 [Xylariomycetidae sp. FL0641]
MEDMHALLLLPEPPQSTSSDHIRPALYHTLLSAIQRLSQNQLSGRTAELDIAVPLTRIGQTVHTHRALFGVVQGLVNNVYQLVKTIFDELGVSAEHYGSIDVRVLLVRDGDETTEEGRMFPAVVTSLYRLASSPRTWTQVFVVEGEQGETMYRRFQTLAWDRGAPWDALFSGVQRLPGGIQIFIKDLHTNGAAAAEPWGAKQIGVFLGGGASEHFADKWLLTMGLFANDGTASLRCLHVASLPALDDTARAKAAAFIASLTRFQHGPSAVVESSFLSLGDFLDREVEQPKLLVASKAVKSTLQDWNDRDGIEIVMLGDR